MISLYFKGFLMGIADIIPGISGGTVALILGIYETLIESINSIEFGKIFKIKIFIKSINFKFLMPLGLGIISSILILSRLLSFLLNEYPGFIWSIFFGLVLTSIIFLIYKYKSYSSIRLLFLLTGSLIGFMATTSPGALVLDFSWPFILLAGFLASFAMILPGISGSYILVLLGFYRPVIDAVKSLDLFVIVMLAVGVLLGISLGSRFINVLIKRYPHQFYALLFGFVLGSLRKISPWSTKALSFDALDLQYFTLMIISSVIAFILLKNQKNKRC